MTTPAEDAIDILGSRSDLDIIVATIRDKLPPLVAMLRQMQDTRPD